MDAGKALGERFVVAGPRNPHQALTLAMLKDVVPNLMEKDVEEHERHQTDTRPLDNRGPGLAVCSHDGASLFERLGVRASIRPGKHHGGLGRS